MAKSKNGGSRAYIRGRIGSDVYSVGKNGMGEKQQVVRSLAEQVANPRSQGQMFGRMVMSTVMQAVSSLSPIIDHSFDGYPKGQPSISQFIKRNYALVKADALAHPADSNNFGLNKYQEKGIKVGHYLISDGNLTFPTGIETTGAVATIALSADAHTVGDLKAAIGISGDDYLTVVGILAETSEVVFFRAQLVTALPDSTVITADNIGAMFSFDGNVEVAATFTSNKVFLTPEIDTAATVDGGLISKKIEGAWKHSKCQLNGQADYEYTADVALPTYPLGEQMFLNGGDL